MEERMRIGTVLLALAIAACGEAGTAALYVELRTDLVAAEEVSAVITELERPGKEPRRVERFVRPGDDLASGIRVADFSGLAPGSHALEVALWTADGTLVGRRPLLVSVAQDHVATVVFTRDCRGVTCPAADGDPLARACLGGQCVSPRCTLETADECGGSECASDADCAVDSPCARGVCQAGGCFLLSEPSACGAEAWCEPETGCVPRRGAATEEATHGRCEGTRWSFLVTGPGEHVLGSLALGPEGLYAVGNLDGDAHIGGDVVDTDQTDVLVARFDDDPSPTWTERLGVPADVEAAGLIRTDAGELVLYGAYDGATEFGGQALAHAGLKDVYLATMDSASGAVRGVRTYGTTDMEQALHLVRTPTGHAISLLFGGPMDFGGGAMLPSSDTLRSGLASFDETGAALWATDVAPNARSAGLASDAMGRLFFHNEVGVRGQLHEVDDSGTILWSGAPDPGSDSAAEAAVDLLAGPDGGFGLHAYSGSFGAEDGPLPAEGVDVVLYRLDDARELVWARHYGGPGDDRPGGLARRPDGSLVFATRIGGLVDFGGGPVGRVFAQSLALVGVAADGAHRFSCALPVTDLLPLDLVVDGMNRAYVAGWFSGQADFGDMPAVSTGARNGFLLALDLP